MKRNFVLENGYRSQTTFYIDFTIADAFGIHTIQDTYNRIFTGFLDEAIFLTELTIVMQIKHLDWDNKNEEYSKLYLKLYNECKKYCEENLTEDDLKYYEKWTKNIKMK